MTTTLAYDPLAFWGFIVAIIAALGTVGAVIVAIVAITRSNRSIEVAEDANRIARGQNQLTQQAVGAAKDAVEKADHANTVAQKANEIAEEALRHQKENVPLELEIIPTIRPESIVPPHDMAHSFMVATIKHLQGPTARIRDIYIETDGSHIQPRWTLINGFTDGVAETKPCVFDLKHGQKAEVFFCERIKGEPGQGKLKAPDYYPMPWGAISTARRVVVVCANSKSDHESKDNEAVIQLRNWVLGHRNNRGPSGRQ